MAIQQGGNDELRQGKIEPLSSQFPGSLPSPVPLVRRLGRPQVPLLGWLRPVQPALQLLVELLYGNSGPGQGTLRGCASGKNRDVVQQVRPGGLLGRTPELCKRGGQGHGAASEAGEVWERARE